VITERAAVERTGTTRSSLNYKNSLNTDGERRNETTRQCGRQACTHCGSSLCPAPTAIRLTEKVEPLDPLERAEHRRQEQLCDPLVPTDTYWYLTATPELLSHAATRLEAFTEIEP